MRKKTIYVLATVMCMSIFTACGSTNRADAGNEVQQEVQAEDNMQKEQQAGAEGNAETELQTEAVPENTAEAVTGEEKTLNGTVDEIKDFMFIVTDDSGASYELSFDAKPQGLENVSVGDKVKVTLRFRGREMAHVNYSKQILDSFCEKLEDIATVDKKPKMEGRSMVLFLSQKR